MSFNIHIICTCRHISENQHFYWIHWFDAGAVPIRAPLVARAILLYPGSPLLFYIGLCVLNILIILIYNTQIIPIEIIYWRVLSQICNTTYVHLDLKMYFSTFVLIIWAIGVWNHVLVKKRRICIIWT